MNDFYTYAYLRKNRTPYYIGKGSGNRIYSTKRRLKPPKDKSRIIFLKQNLTEEEAFEHETYMIAVFGRKDLGTGILRNLTDGGEGFSGLYWNEERKNSISKRFSKSFKLVSPELKIISSHHIGKFCEKYNLIPAVISSVLTGKRKSHRGWTHPNRPLSCKIFYIINPKGKLFCFGDIDKFCNKHNLSKSNVYDLVINERRKSSNGWYSLTSKFEEHKLLSPDGKVVIWKTNDRTFYKKYNLKKWVLQSLVSGEFNQTKGWTLYDNPIQKYKLLSPEKEIIEFINITKFSKENGLNRDNVGYLLRGMRNEYKGWTKT
jgi:hypothetical protein